MNLKEILLEYGDMLTEEQKQQLNKLSETNSLIK